MYWRRSCRMRAQLCSRSSLMAARRMQIWLARVSIDARALCQKAQLRTPPIHVALVQYGVDGGVAVQVVGPSVVPLVRCAGQCLRFRPHDGEEIHERSLGQPALVLRHPAQHAL
eukprot:141861-Prymnesium_polylepis.1